MARPSKALWEHVSAGTFRSERHGELLDRGTLPAFAPAELRELQERYRSAGSKRERQALRVEFAEAARRFATGREKLSFDEFLLATTGPAWSDLEHLGLSYAEFEQLEQEWARWNEEHGLAWRARHGCLWSVDRERLYELLTGRAESNVDLIDDAWSALVGRVAELLDLDADVRDPPGWELVTRY